MMKARRHEGTKARSGGDAGTSPERERRVGWWARAVRADPALALGARGRTAFTLVELLVVIVVIGILIAAIGLIGSRVHRSQKIRVTETTMKTVKAAIDQFSTQNPLGAIYGRKEGPGADGVWNTTDDARPTFGPYPPYQLAFPRKGVAWVLEPSHPLVVPAGVPATLANRVARDLSGQAAPTLNLWANLVTDPNTDDIRALYTYLKLYAPSELGQVPGTAVKPLASVPEYVNPSGAGTTPGTTGLVDVLGIHDAWGVPLNYMLYVKVEVGLLPSGATGWRVTDRTPVLRSRGVTQEEYVAELSGANKADPEKWIFSDPFPRPATAIDESTGELTGTNTRANGWVRLKAAGHEQDYTYVP